MQTFLVAVVVVAALGYIVRNLWRSLSGECGGCGGKKAGTTDHLVPVSELTARVRERQAVNAGRSVDSSSAPTGQ